MIKLVKRGKVYKIMIGVRAVGIYDPAQNTAKVPSKYHRYLAHELLQHLVGTKLGSRASSKLMMEE